MVRFKLFNSSIFNHELQITIFRNKQKYTLSKGNTIALPDMKVNVQDLENLLQLFLTKNVYCNLKVSTEICRAV